MACIIPSESCTTSLHQGVMKLLFPFVYFVFFGCFGLLIELFFNGIRKNLINTPRNWSVKGEVSLWMFLIYGTGLSFGFDLVLFLIGDWPLLARLMVYPILFWGVEIAVGFPLWRWKKVRLWDYSSVQYIIHGKTYSPSRVEGTIRLDYAPLWMLFGFATEEVRRLFDIIYPALFT